MRVLSLTLALSVLAAVGVDAQTCRKGSAAPIKSLFPTEMVGLAGQFYTSADGCFTHLYKPADSAADASAPWAVVMIEPHGKPLLGYAVDGVRAFFLDTGAEVHEAGGWVVAFRAGNPVGAEFVTIKDDLQVTVVVKNGTDPISNLELADGIFAEILPKILVPCK